MGMGSKINDEASVEVTIVVQEREKEPPSIFARKQRKARKRNAVPWTPKPEEEAPLIGADDQFGAILPAGNLAPGRITMMANADMGRHSSARSQKKSQLLALKNSVRSKK